jgi:hypothetical protein
VWHDNNEQHQAKFQEEEEEDIICICPQMFFYEILKWMNDLDCPLSDGTSFNKGFVCHIVALPFYILKISILRQKRRIIMENSNISPCKIIIFKKILLKRNQNTSRYHNSIINLKFQHKPKISSFKDPHIK